MTAPLKRRWFRFSLRTMFVVVTMLAISLGWLVWQWRIVQERTSLLREIERVDPVTFVSWSVESAVTSNLGANVDFEHIRVSFVRQLLGDEAYLELGLPEGLDRKCTERVEIAFPEARLYILRTDGRAIESTHFRDSLLSQDRQPNRGTIFKTGLIEK